jgi:hypothetical protein
MGILSENRGEYTPGIRECLGVPFQEVSRRPGVRSPKYDESQSHKEVTMSGQNSNAVHITIKGADNVPNNVVDTGTNSATPLPASAGVAVTATKNAAGKVTGVHGTVSGLTVDLPDSGE